MNTHQTFLCAYFAEIFSYCLCGWWTTFRNIFKHMFIHNFRKNVTKVNKTLCYCHSNGSNYISFGLEVRTSTTFTYNISNYTFPNWIFRFSCLTTLFGCENSLHRANIYSKLNYFRALSLIALPFATKNNE